MAHVHTGTEGTLGPQQHHQHGAPGGPGRGRRPRRTARTCAPPQHCESPAQKPGAAPGHRRKHGAVPRGDAGALNARGSQISRRRNGSCSHRNKKNAGTATASSIRRAGKASLSANCAAKSGGWRGSAARRKPCSKAGCRSESSPKARGCPPKKSGRSERARQSHFTKEEWLMFTQEQKERWDRNSIINTARREGRDEGIALGELRGEKRGLARLRSTAKALLKSRVPLRVRSEEHT